MMFGLPAAALAMYKTAMPSQKKAIGGLLLSLAFTAFLTGLSLFVCQLLNVLHGFTFSAGVMEFFLNGHLATNQWLIIPIGLAFGAVYYFTFVFAIKKFNLATPGRTEEDSEESNMIVEDKGLGYIARQYIKLLGGSEKFVEIDSCITRLRLIVKVGYTQDRQVKL